MEDKETISKLYSMCKEDIYKMKSQNIEITKKIAEETDILYKNLTEEQIQIIDKINQYENERVEIINKEVFKYAFSLATKLFAEGLTEKTNIKK